MFLIARKGKAAVVATSQRLDAYRAVAEIVVRVLVKVTAAEHG